MSEILVGDVRDVLPTLKSESVQMCVTSPPYWGLRDYGVDGQLGLEKTPEEYVAKMVDVFREVRRVLKDDGTCWVNLGMSYAASGGGAHKDWHANPGISKSSTRGGVPHDTQPIQSHSDVPACGIDGKEPRYSQGDDRACRDSCDEPQGETPSHHDRTVRNDQSDEQGGPQTSQITRDNERSDSGQASLGALPPVARVSNTLASQENGQDVSCHEGAVSVGQQEQKTSSCDVHRSSDNSAYTDDTSPMSPPLVVRTEGKESFFSACRRSDCKGIGRCGICWCSLAIPPLNFKPKDEINIPHLVAMALQADGWFLRQTIVWSKPNPMPESVTDRCTKAHEYLFLLSKAPRYYFDAEAIKEPAQDWGPRNRAMNSKGARPEKTGQPAHSFHEGRSECAYSETGRNKRSVWTIPSQPYADAHFATFPPKLIEPCILAGSRPGDVVLDPFLGSGTTGQVCERLGRDWVGIELSSEYAEMAKRRTAQMGLVI